jgi:cytochrome c-type biogenesis protein CcmF
VLIASFGAGCLLAGLVLAIFATVMGLRAGRRDDERLGGVARRAFYVAAASVAGASVLLLCAFVTDDFVVGYVTENSNRALSLPLKLAGFYGGQEGSLLYWTLALTVIGSVSVAATVRRSPLLATYAAAVLGAVASFFLLLLVFVASPFSTLGAVPRDGLGLNPILRDGGMLIHPPFQLAGYSSFAIPFAFAMASLLARRHDATWIAQTRRVALVSWGLQSAGLLLGMWWAYHVLGWGGYFGWDPVENVALMPWLAVTAYLHSVQVQERKGRLRAWNFGLVILAFLLTIYGTFIVRSGIVPSVHTFAISPLGPYFFVFLAVCILASGVLLASRSSALRSDRPLQAAVSREGTFVIQNVLIVLLIGAVLWGTLLPVVTAALGRQMVVGPAYYERAGSPLMVLLLLLLAAGPLLPWRELRGGSVPARRALRAWLLRLRLPALAAAAVLVLLLALGLREPGGLIVVPLVAGGLVTCGFEYARAIRTGLRLAGSASALPAVLLRLAARNRRRYGAYLTHVGVLAIAVGIAGSTFWQQHNQVQVRPGQTVSVGAYHLTYLGSSTHREGDHTTLVSRLRLDDGEELQPTRQVYPTLGGEVVSRVVIRSTPLEDLYVVLTDASPNGAVTVNAFVNPLVPWIWAGGLLLVVGVLIGNLGPMEVEPARDRRTALRPRTAPAP